MMPVNMISIKNGVTHGGNQHNLKPRETIKYRNRSIRNRDNGVTDINYAVLVQVIKKKIENFDREFEIIKHNRMQI